MRSREHSRIFTSYQFIAHDIENKLKSPSSMYLSLMLKENTAFMSCLLGAGNGCRSKEVNFDPKNPNYFSLAYQTGATAIDRLTGMPDSPIFYDTQGKRCKRRKNSVRCVFKATTFFYATCDPKDGLTCLTGPVELHVAYSVSQLPKTLTDLGFSFKPLPRTIRFHTHKLVDILGPFRDSDCNPGAVIVGYDRRGRSRCECRQPYVPIDVEPFRTRRGPICRATLAAELTCPKDLVFRGLKPDGTANCLSPTEAYHCISFQSTNMNADACPRGYWVQEDRRSGCKFYCTIPKQASSWCKSDESNEDRAWDTAHTAQIYRTVTGNINQVHKSQQYRIGLGCDTRTLVCCQPK